MRTYSVFLTVLFLVLLAVFLHKPSGHDQKLLEIENQYRHRIDSVRAHYRQLIAEDSITFIAYQKAKYAQFKAEAEAKIWQQRYEKQRTVIVRYSDSELDSLLSAIR